MTFSGSSSPIISNWSNTKQNKTQELTTTQANCCQKQSRKGSLLVSNSQHGQTQHQTTSTCTTINNKHRDKHFLFSTSTSGHATQSDLKDQKTPFEFPLPLHASGILGSTMYIWAAVETANSSNWPKDLQVWLEVYPPISSANWLETHYFSMVCKAGSKCRNHQHRATKQQQQCSTYNRCIFIVTDPTGVQRACVGCFHAGVESRAWKARRPDVSFRVEGWPIMYDLTASEKQTGARDTSTQYPTIRLSMYHTNETMQLVKDKKKGYVEV